MTILNQADKLYIGSNQVSAVYAGSTKVWPIFKPTDLSGCAIWMDASKLGLASGAAVNTWTNLGNGSQPVLQSSPAPTFVINQLNTNMPIVRITQGQGRFRWLSGTGVDKDWTLIYVGRRWVLRGGRVVAALSTAANLLVGYHGNEMDQCFVEGWITPTTQTSTLQWKLYSADSTSTGPAQFFSDGLLMGTGTVTPANGWGGTLCMSGYDAAASQEADAEFAELVMYNRKLSDVERKTVENYLRAKWNPIKPFTPLDLGTNVVSWFDAASGISLSTGVQVWNTRNGGSGLMYQGTAAYQPSYANNTVTSNSGQVFYYQSGPIGGYDVIWVGRPLPASVGDWRTFIRNVTSPHHVIIESGSTRIGTYNGGFFPAGGLTWDNVWGIGCARIGAGQVAMLARDGGPMTSTGTTIATGQITPDYVGGYQGPPPSQGWGDIKEMVWLPYNSEGCRPMVEGYLANKHGLQGLLPANHPYKNTPPS
jgi:hypothetical protein